MNWLGLIIGAATGWLIGYLFRCQGGACPLTGNWWIPTILGAILGFTWTSGRAGKQPEAEEHRSADQDTPEPFDIDN